MLKYGRASLKFLKITGMILILLKFLGTSFGSTLLCSYYSYLERFVSESSNLATFKLMGKLIFGYHSGIWMHEMLKYTS